MTKKSGNNARWVEHPPSVQFTIKRGSMKRERHAHTPPGGGVDGLMKETLLTPCGRMLALHLSSLWPVPIYLNKYNTQYTFLPNISPI